MDNLTPQPPLRKQRGGEIKVTESFAKDGQNYADGYKVSSVSLDGVRFEVVEPICHRITGEKLDGWEVRERAWWFHLDDAAMWKLVGMGVLDFAPGERFTVLGYEGDVVDCGGWEAVLDVGGALVGVGCPVWREGRVYDIEMVRCIRG